MIGYLSTKRTQNTNFLMNQSPNKLHQYGDFQESEKASKEVLSLPMHPFLSAEEQDEITNQLIEVV